MHLSNFRLYPTTKLTINPAKYTIIDNSFCNNKPSNEYSSNKECEMSALEDIYSEDERKTILEFRWDKPGYIRWQKTISNSYIMPFNYTSNCNYDIKPINISNENTTNSIENKNDINDVYNDIDSIPSESPTSSLANSIICIPDCISDSDINSNEVESLSYYHVPPYEELVELAESEEFELDITALADAFDELTVEDHHTTDDESDVNSELIGY